MPRLNCLLATGVVRKSSLELGHRFDLIVLVHQQASAGNIVERSSAAIARFDLQRPSEGFFGGFEFRFFQGRLALFDQPFSRLLLASLLRLLWWLDRNAARRFGIFAFITPTQIGKQLIGGEQ